MEGRDKEEFVVDVVVVVVCVKVFRFVEVGDK